MKSATKATNAVVITHADCNDGFCCAWIFHILKEKDYENVEYIFSRDRSKFPTLPPEFKNEKNIDVYIFDFSFTFEIMKDINSRFSNVLLIDHHESAQKELESLVYCLFNKHHSAARLVWDYFTDDSHTVLKPPPILVSYIEDRDLWRHQLYKTKEFNAGLSARDRTFHEWTSIHSSMPEAFNSMAHEGKILLKSSEKAARKMAEKSYEIIFDGFRVPCLNATSLISEIGEILSSGNPFSITWFHNGKEFVYSLRSNKDQEGSQNVSEIAKKYGGGGHKHAAGFSSQHQYFLNKATNVIT